MSNDDSKSQDQTPDPEPSQPSEAQPGSETVEPTEPERFGDDAPSWAQGKTKEELLQMTENLVNSGLGGGGQSQTQTQQQQQAQQYQPPQQSQQQQMQQQYQQAQQYAAQNQLPEPPDPDMHYDNPQEYKRRLQQWQQANTNAAIQQTVQQLAPMMQNMGENAKMMAKQDPKVAKVFEKYEPEIVAQMNQIPQANRTVQAWKMAAEMVAGRHVDELAREQAESLAAQQPSPTSRQGGGGPTGTERSYNDAIDKLWDKGGDYVRKAKENGVTKTQLRQRASQMQLSPEEFVERVEGLQATGAGFVSQT